jgi:hypothetical protein
MNFRIPLFCCWAFFLCCASAGGESSVVPGGARVEGRFGRALLPVNDPAHRAQLPGNAAYQGAPLTVECWAKLNDKSHFNILVASESKASPAHWELYSYAGSGCFSAYLPGNEPAEIVSKKVITDDQWHYLAMVLDGARVRLYVDAEEVADAPFSRGLKSPTLAPLFLGDVEGIGCRGLVDEVRISNTARTVTTIPQAPFDWDAETLALAHFEGDGSTPPPVKPNWPPGLVEGPGGLPCQQRIWSASEWPEELFLPGVRAEVVADWKMQFDLLRDQQYGLGISNLLPHVPDQTLDQHALIQESDRDPLDVVLRRTEALLQDLQVEGFSERLAVLRAAAAQAPAMTREETNNPARQRLYLYACVLRREIALANPLLDFEDLLFVVRGVIHGPMEENTDWFGQHQSTQFYAFNSVAGGGLYVLKGFKGETPAMVDLLKDAVVENGRHKGEKLDYGAFMSPDLSYDGKTLLFSWTENTEHRAHDKESWTENSVWHVFRVNTDGTGLRQLTDGPYNDFQACWLPNGRIAFISERRGGFIRCFVSMWVPNYVLHSMKADGSDLYPLSYFETSEWDPSVNNDGMLVYSRWDYVDRNDCLGSNFWICYPDGRDPRAPHGNYPRPWHTLGRSQEESMALSTRNNSPFTEMGIRSIPGSHRYVLSAVPHHGEAFGSLALLDLRDADDGAMGQLKRITPYAKFPEIETPGRRYDVQQYGTPWPLSEDYYLCNYFENLYLLDRFGNQELLGTPAETPNATYPYFRAMDPIPFRPRPTPPVIPTKTNQGEDADPLAPKARVSVANVYDTDIPFPEGTEIKWLRVLQNIVKDNHEMDKPRIGYGEENTPRIPLGIVPVEEDGSAHFWAPVEKELIFQALDEDFMAVQSMKSVAYVHPGEHLSCVGCHEKTQATPKPVDTPLALRREPSTLQSEAGPIEPINFHRLVKPIFEKKCVPCHQEENAEPIAMNYAALEDYAFYWAGGFMGHWCDPEHNGARTIPGRFGARASRLGQKLLEPEHRKVLSEQEYRSIILWLDGNSLELGAFHSPDAQRRGEVVWPLLDVDPAAPQGFE